MKLTYFKKRSWTFILCLLLKNQNKLHCCYAIKFIFFNVIGNTIVDKVSKKSSAKKKAAKRRRSRKPMTRSQMMQAVHSEDTKPEMIVRKALFEAGFRYRLHRRDLPGTPDIFVQRYGVAIFVNGCFWHQHGCKLTSRPKSNSAFWNDKFDRNIVRDIKTQHELSLLGYRVAIVWECSLRVEGVADAGNMGAALTLERLIDFIKSDDETIEL